MLRFQYSSLINAPVEVVWQFHERKDILDLLTPPWQPVKVICREGGLEVGAITEFRLFLGPIPVRWLAKHIECQPNCSFTDKQVEGRDDNLSASPRLPLTASSKTASFTHHTIIQQRHLLDLLHN